MPIYYPGVSPNYLPGRYHHHHLLVGGLVDVGGVLPIRLVVTWDGDVVHGGVVL